jgi:hypothetical protein
MDVGLDGIIEPSTPGLQNHKSKSAIVQQVYPKLLADGYSIGNALAAEGAATEQC